MGKIVIGLVGLVVGVILGAVVGGALLGGGAAGLGVATGLSAGICTTVEAAQAEGLMTAEDVDRVLARAAADAAALTGAEEPAAASDAADCDAVLARLREAAAEG